DFVSESKEDDNCATSAGQVEVKQAPNLVVSTISNPPSPQVQGGKFTAKDTVKNTGLADALVATTTRYSLVGADGIRHDLKRVPDPTTGQIKTVPPLGVGEPYPEENDVIIKDGIPTGLYNLQACADTDRLVPEQDDSDNCLLSSGKVQVNGSPDLAVTSV